MALERRPGPSPVFVSHRRRQGPALVHAPGPAQEPAAPIGVPHEEDGRVQGLGVLGDHQLNIRVYDVCILQLLGGRGVGLRPRGVAEEQGVQRGLQVHEVDVAVRPQDPVVAPALQGLMQGPDLRPGLRPAARQAILLVSMVDVAVAMALGVRPVDGRRQVGKHRTLRVGTHGDDRNGQSSKPSRLWHAWSRAGHRPAQLLQR
mmetsp:Transcript_67734/g.201477  ORF Transcript_67734/g.201477 Transcript_67734/m.201477 type:complete len:203 (+) Transcript_67734:436-1044(+)